MTSFQMAENYIQKEKPDKLSFINETAVATIIKPAINLM